MKVKKYYKTFCIVLSIFCLCLVSCSNGEKQGPPEPEALSLEGKSLNIYCGAGMTNPFQEISDTFKEKTGCEMKVTFANAGQIQTQINTSKEGDIFIAGSAEELKPVEESVTEKIDLVKHIPVLAVQKGNPSNIIGLNDLVNADLKIALGDDQSTPIGKIANKALGDAGILDKVNIAARTTTAPQLITALEVDECDAVIVWKENVGDKAEIVDAEEMKNYVKTIPAASLAYSSDEDTRAAFMEYLLSEEVMSIWKKHGYETVE